MTQKYQVKVSMKQAAIVETGIVLKQGDFGMQIEIEVLDFDATGTTPQIVFRKAMGAVESTTITVSSNKYTYTFKGTELDTPGKVFCDLKLKNSTTQRISTASFMFKVVADTLDGLNQQSESYSDTVEQIVGSFNSDLADLNTSFLKQNEFRSHDITNAVLYGDYESVSVSTQNGGLQGDVGDTITITSTSSYHYCSIDATNINALLIGLTASNSNSYPYYVYACDNSDKILSRYIPKKSIGSYCCEIVTLPYNCKKVYIMSSSTISIKRILANEEFYKKSVNMLMPFVNDYGYFDTGTQKWVSSANSKASMYIPVESGETWYYTSTITSWVGFFDVNFEYLTRVKFEASNDVSLPASFTVPANVGIKYMLLVISTNHESVSNLMLTKIPSPQVMIPYGKVHLKELTLSDEKIMIFGDSISFKQIRWVSTFLALTQPSEYLDYAVNGAKWCDMRYDTTYPYAGNPSSDDSNNNVMGNQVQRAINEHLLDPNYIIMFCGTNDNYRYDDDTTMEQQFTDANGEPIDLDDVMRYTLAGSMRWCIENLKTEFPGAKIIIITPIQCAYGVRNITIQKKRNERILETAHRLGCEAFNAWGESGIYSAFETSGSMGQYLVDGLHPYPPTGGKILGLYIANKFISAVGLAK